MNLFGLCSFTLSNHHVFPLEKCHGVELQTCTKCRFLGSDKVNITVSHWWGTHFSRGAQLSVCGAGICKHTCLILTTVYSFSLQETYDTIPGQNKITFLLQAIRDASAAEEVGTEAHFHDIFLCFRHELKEASQTQECSITCVPDLKLW